MTPKEYRQIRDYLKEHQSVNANELLKFIWKLIERPNCIAHIRREFYLKTGEHDGGETEFVYDNDPIADDLLKCKTLEEARKLLEYPSDTFRIEITKVKTKNGFLP